MLGSRRASISTVVLDFEQRQGRVALEHSTLLHSLGLPRPMGALSTRRAGRLRPSSLVATASLIERCRLSTWLWLTPLIYLKAGPR